MEPDADDHAIKVPGPDPAAETNYAFAVDSDRALTALAKQLLPWRLRRTPITACLWTTALMMQVMLSLPPSSTP